MGKDIDESKLIGGKRKNGHKLNCHCHICENMKNKAKRGGYKEEVEKAQERMMGGSKKKNGHRKDCKCPICKNMNNSRKRGKRNGTKKSKKLRGGDGEDEDEEEFIEDDEEVMEDETPSDEEEEDISDEEEEESSDEEEEEEQKGGRKKKGNGHKPNCKCPICKNMRKSKKGKKGGDIENQMGDIEEGGVEATSVEEVVEEPSNEPEGREIEASDDEYDALIAAEEGRAGPNVVGGTRRKRKDRKSRKNRKTRKIRRNHRHRR
jgi:hypothetical protein